MELKNKTFSYSSGNMKLDIDISKYENRFNVAQTMLDTHILQDTEPYVRYDTGTLNLYSLYNNDRGSGEIIYRAERNGKPYARYTYYNTHNMVTTTHHSQATPLWFEISKLKNKDKWINEVKQIVGGK